MEAIDSIKIVHVEGLTNASGNGGGDGGAGDGNFASSAVAAALRYRAQAPIVDGLMKELGFDGTTLDSLVAGATQNIASPAPPAKTAPAAEAPLVSAPPAKKKD
jgi:hypothetical protein